jgi:hypothetical protein
MARDDIRHQQKDLRHVLQRPVKTTAALTTFAEISGTRPGNITVTPGNCVIITQAFG